MALGVTLSDTQLSQFLTFRSLLLDWNERMNLTAIIDPHQIMVLHFVDALTCGLACDTSTPQRLLDIGSGAGIPGLALAIAFPTWQVMTLEATGKKVRFQETVIDEIGLSNATAVHGRAEVYAYESSWRGRFSVVTARAVAVLPTLLEWCEPFAQVGGVVITPKKGDIDDEIARGAHAAQILGGSAPEIVRLPSALIERAPEMGDGRVIIRTTQEHPTPPRYPRSGGTPVRAPLG